MEEAVFAVADDGGDFVEVYRAHYGRLVRALELAGAGRATAEDLAQEAFARTYRHWRRVREGLNPSGYPYRVAFRLAARDRRGLAAAERERTVGGGEEEAAVGADGVATEGNRPGLGDVLADELQRRLAGVVEGDSGRLDRREQAALAVHSAHHVVHAGQGVGGRLHHQVGALGHDLELV